MASKRAGLHKVMKRHFLQSLGQRDGHGWTCFYCHCNLRAYGDNGYPDSPAIEHRIPLARGGNDEMTNLRLACAACNKAKGTKTDSEFMSDSVLTPLPLNYELSEYQLEWRMELNRMLYQLERFLNPHITAGARVDDSTLVKRTMNIKKADW